MKKDKKKKKKDDIPSFETDEEKEEYLREELNKILEQLKVQDSPLNAGLTKKIKRRQFLMSIVNYLFIVALIFALSGYIKWADFSSIWMTFVFSGIVVGVDVCLTFMLYFFFPKLILNTFGLITIFILPVSLIIGVVFSPGLEIVSFGSTLLFAFLVIVFHMIIKTALSSNRIMLKIKR